MPAVRTVARKPKKTAFVPRSIFLGVLATTSVIPLCACGGDVAGGSGDSGIEDALRGGDVAVQGFTVARQAFDAGRETGVFTDAVAACCFGVADAAFVADVAFGVAVDAFVPDAAFVADVAFGVGVMAFDGSTPKDAPIPFVACCAFDSGK